LLIAFFVWLSRRSAGAGGGLGGFARSKAKIIVNEQRPSVRFDDVAGYDGVKEELGEILDFLRNPDKYARVGAKGPGGVLMLGPPGTGKTLFARALAGEAKVPFLSVTGSAFVELFVGVGAARVRDLFEQARGMAPAIVFIDEIDAVGQRRGGNSMLNNDEREQTVNQLLAEMDGFDPSIGVVVLAATNRPDVLDPALLRPGRFDRQVVIPLPNRDERAAILRVHCKGKPLAGDVDAHELARATPGFSGADLANLANEAAIHAVRHKRDVITVGDFDAARDRILLGRRDGTMLLPDERRAVAVHESGHALVAALSPGADPVSKVTILPSGPALGATQQLPLDDRHLYSESYLRTSLAVLLGGRAAELVAVGQASSGAADDLAKATDLATRMVRELGMSAEIGPVGYSSGTNYLGRDDFGPRPFADATQRAIDLEVARVVRDAQEQAIRMLTAAHRTLERLVALLLEEETIDGERVYALLGTAPPEAPPRATPATTPAPIA
jgi:cell division protease FtsH